MNSIEMLRHVPADYIRIAKSYGLDVWIVTYDNGPDFESERGEATELRFRENIFKRLPTIDHWCIKSGDPGDLTLERFSPSRRKRWRCSSAIIPKRRYG